MDKVKEVRERIAKITKNTHKIVPFDVYIETIALLRKEFDYSDKGYQCELNYDWNIEKLQSLCNKINHDAIKLFNTDHEYAKDLGSFDEFYSVKLSDYQLVLVNGKPYYIESGPMDLEEYDVTIDDVHDSYKIVYIQGLLDQEKSQDILAEYVREAEDAISVAEEYASVNNLSFNLEIARGMGGTFEYGGWTSSSSQC